MILKKLIKRLKSPKLFTIIKEVPKIKKELNVSTKKFNKMNDYMGKAKNKLPILKNSLRKYKGKYMNNSESYLRSKKKFIFPATNSQFDKTKINLRLKGGKINLFKSDINIRIPKSNSKFDFVPPGLLLDRKKILENENKC